MKEELGKKSEVTIENKKTLEYPREFFDLQIEFARKIAQVLRIPISQALLQYTVLFRRLNIDRSLNATDSVWQEFLASLTDENLPDRAYQLYLQRKDIELELEPDKKKFGCFTLEYKSEEKCVKIHFTSKENDGGPLDDKNLSKRMQEIKGLFEYVRETYPDALIVRGGSWLYNLSKYKRLFPPEFSRDAQPATRYHFGGMSVWGQFLDQNMKIKSDQAKLFRERLSRAESLDQLEDSLPLQTLEVGDYIEDFYRYYGIQ